MKYFSNCKNDECSSALLVIAEFFFAIPSHNANIERVFSLMQSQWTKERKKLHAESVKGIIFVQHNFKHLSCSDFYTYLCSQPKLLKATRSSDKYTWSQPLAQSSSSLTVTDGCSVLMCLQYCYVTTSNGVVNYQDIFSVMFCAHCEYSKTCKPICVICI